MEKKEKKNWMTLELDVDSKNILHALGWIFLVIVCLIICFLLFDLITAICSVSVGNNINGNFTTVGFLSIITGSTFSEVCSALSMYNGFKLFSYITIPYGYVIAMFALVYVFIYHFIALIKNFIKNKSPFISKNVSILDKMIRIVVYSLVIWVIFDFAYQMIFIVNNYYLRFPVITFVFVLCLTEVARYVIKYGNNVEKKLKSNKKEK